MGLINDTKFAALGAAGFTGDIRLRELAWLQSLGATSNDINDAWRQIAGSGGTQMESRWLINGNGAGTTRLSFPTDWSPTGSNWALRLNAQSVNPAGLSARTFVLANSSGNSTVNDGVFMGYNSTETAYAIEVHQNFGQVAFNTRVTMGDATANQQINMQVNSTDGSINYTGPAPQPTEDFDPLTFGTVNFVYSNWGQNSSPIFIDFIDNDDDSNSRRYDLTIVSETEPPTQTSFTDQNDMNAATLTNQNPTTFWRQVTIQVPGSGAGGEHINEIKRNYYLANGGTGLQFNDIELSFWQAF